MNESSELEPIGVFPIFRYAKTLHPLLPAPPAALALPSKGALRAFDAQYLAALRAPDGQLIAPLRAPVEASFHRAA